jgi:glycosyltransferase involved in cell wall biosynthesis
MTESATTKKRILVIDELTPEPDMDSGSLDVYNYLKIFKNLDYHVTFIPRNIKHCGQYTESLERLGVECVYHPHVQSFAEAIKKYAPLINYIFIYRAFMAYPIVDCLHKYAPQAKLIFNTVDLHHLRKKREAQKLKSLKKLFWAIRLKYIEFRVIKKVDATILLSQHELKLVERQVPGAKLFHIPIVREIPGPSNTSWDARRDLIFIGNYKHPPNVDAVKYFLNHVWANLQSSHFPGRFIIAGSNMPVQFSSLGAKDVVVRGHVPDLDDLFDQCRLSVAPLRFGAGMKGKIITSLSYGVPCITTSIGVEGSGLVSGKDILVEDDPEKMAKLIQHVYHDKLSWQNLSAAGLEYCIQNCSMESVAAKIESMMLAIS